MNNMLSNGNQETGYLMQYFFKLIVASLGPFIKLIQSIPLCIYCTWSLNRVSVFRRVRKIAKSEH